MQSGKITDVQTENIQQGAVVDGKVHAVSKEKIKGIDGDCKAGGAAVPVFNTQKTGRRTVDTADGKIGAVHQRIQLAQGRFGDNAFLPEVETTSS